MSMDLDTPHKKKTKNAETPKSQSKFKIWEHVYVKKHSKPTSKVFAIEFRDVDNKRKSVTFNVDEIKDVAAFVKKHHGKTLNIGATKIPLGINEQLRKAIRSNVNYYLMLTFADPFVAEFRSILESHGGLANYRKNYHSIKMPHNNNPIKLDESDNAWWKYQKFHYVANIGDRDERKQTEAPFKINGMFRKFPHVQNVIIEYREKFDLDEFILEHMDLIITGLSGKFTVKINEQSFEISEYHQIYILKDTIFSYSVPRRGATIELMGLNDNIPQIGNIALDAKKEEVAVLRIEKKTK